MAERFNVYQAVTDRILDALEKGIVPWQRPFRIEGGVHRNLNSKKAYRGVNQMLLDITAMSKGYFSPYWLTYNAAKKMGGKVRKGETSTVVVFWKRLEVADVNAPNGKKVIPMLRYFRVFNVAQVDGIEDKIPAPAATATFNAIETAEDIVKGYADAPIVKHGYDMAAYLPRQDEVVMPKPENFHTDEGYYSTLFHELAHSTGHESRLNREGVVKSDGFGGEVYSREELCAEITAAFLNSMAGIDHATFDNSAAYLAGWKSALGRDEKLIVRAAADAQKASDYILGIKWDNDDTKTEDN